MATNGIVVLKWGEHNNTLSSAFGDLLVNSDFIDVTIACEGHSFNAHKVVLSACSPYFKKLLRSNPCKHPVIILRDVSAVVFGIMLKYMYNGMVDIPVDILNTFLAVGKSLLISGLADQTQSAAVVPLGGSVAGPSAVPASPTVIGSPIAPTGTKKRGKDKQLAPKPQKSPRFSTPQVIPVPPSNISGGGIIEGETSATNNVSATPAASQIISLSGYPNPVVSKQIFPLNGDFSLQNTLQSRIPVQQLANTGPVTNVPQSFVLLPSAAQVNPAFVNSVVSTSAPISPNLTSLAPAQIQNNMLSPLSVNNHRVQFQNMGTQLKSLLTENSKGKETSTKKAPPNVVRPQNRTASQDETKNQSEKVAQKTHSSEGNNAISVKTEVSEIPGKSVISPEQNQPVECIIEDSEEEQPNEKKIGEPDLITGDLDDPLVDIKEEDFIPDTIDIDIEDDEDSDSLYGQSLNIDENSETVVDTTNITDSDENYNSSKILKIDKKTEKKNDGTYDLRLWLLQHSDSPYPTAEETEQLALQTGLTVKNVEDWFENARRDILPSITGVFETTSNNPDTNPYQCFSSK